MPWQAGTEWSWEPKVEIQAGEVPDLPPAEDPAVFHLHVAEPEAAELVAHQALQAEEAGDDISYHVGFSCRFLFSGNRIP